MTTKHPTVSPFYDHQFANQTNRRTNRRTPPPRRIPQPDQLSTTIGCRLCGAPARISHQPSKTVYRCSRCKTLLATLTPAAEISPP